MKNLVVCCDGTGNEISENISNVLKLYRMLRKTDKTSPRQVAFYDPGVGTLARPDPWTKLRQDAATLFGLATGYGLDDNILRPYGFLVRNYEEGDDIFLFGFSRGAYTVRVLAAFIHKVGLLAPEQLNLAGAALAAYKETGSAGAALSESATSAGDGGFDSTPPAERADPASQFARIVSSRWPTVAFLGVWDTVASIVVPRPGKLRPFSLQRLPFTRANLSVKVFRQAMAIDERRRMFRLEPWDEPQVFMHNRFSATNNSRPQDSLQVWFAGGRGGRVRPVLQHPERQPARLGSPTAREPVQLCGARLDAGAAPVHDARLACPGVAPEKRRAQGVGRAPLAYRPLCPALGAPCDRGGRPHTPIGLR